MMRISVIKLWLRERKLAVAICVQPSKTTEACVGPQRLRCRGPSRTELWLHKSPCRQQGQKPRHHRTRM